jgi:hypothetical protein
MRKTLLFSLIICCFSAISQAQSPLFSDDIPLEMTLSVDLEGLFADRLLDDPDYRPARISLSEASTVKDIPVRVKVGGNFRKNPNHCEFPPLRLKFEKNDTRRSLFTGNKKLKLVTPCAGNDYVLKEYLVYKMYQELSEESFEVRLAKVTLADQGSDTKPRSFLGFLIEDDDKVASRTGSDVKEMELAESDYERTHITRLAVFQYMIGNRDWDLTLLKNIKLLQREEQFFALPYDFDFSGIVAPPYVIDHMGSDLSELRSFAFVCRSKEELEEAIETVSNTIPVWKKMMKDFDLLAKGERSRMLRFIKFFEKKAQKPEKLIDEFAARCKN